MAYHSSILAWEIPWAEEPSRLQSMRSWRVQHDWATSLSLFTFMHWRKWQPTAQCSCLENPRDSGAWWVDVCGVAQRWTRLKWLSSSSISNIIFKKEKLHINVGLFVGFPDGSVVKNLPANAEDLGSIPGLGRSPGEGNGLPLQYSCLGNPMDRGAWWATVYGVGLFGDFFSFLIEWQILTPR